MRGVVLARYARSGPIARAVFSDLAINSQERGGVFGWADKGPGPGCGKKFQEPKGTCWVIF